MPWFEVTYAPHIETVKVEAPDSEAACDRAYSVIWGRVLDVKEIGGPGAIADIWAHRDDPGEWSEEAVEIEVRKGWAPGQLDLYEVQP